MKKIKFLIFDCDGVLVDSEWLAGTVESQFKTELGFAITLEDQLKKFVGLAANDPLMVADRSRYPASYEEELDKRVHALCETDLKAVGGVIEALRDLELPRCVASNSQPEWIEAKLEQTGLASFFRRDHLFSARQVSRPKPAPDLFLHAAQRMNWPVDECLVIEDSVAGVTAGHAAGMRVCGFLGGSHLFAGHADRLFSAGADLVVKDLRHLSWMLKKG